MQTQTVKQSPILFSTDMVQAILEGRKGQTRRVMKPQPKAMNEEFTMPMPVSEFNKLLRLQENKGYKRLYAQGPLTGMLVPNCPFGKTGDLLWVREKFRLEEAFEYEGEEYPAKYWYYASTPEKVTCIDGELEDRDNYRWKPSIHMPKAACRIWLEIVNVKAELLQDITKEQIISEGVRIPMNGTNIALKLGEENSALNFMPEGFMAKDYTGPQITEDMIFKAHWAELWCKINGRESWDANPWVWVIEFKRVEKPEVRP